MSQSNYFKGRLYIRMAEDLHLGGMSEATYTGYLRAVRKLADFSKTSPDKITEDQLRRYSLHIKNDLHYAYGTLRVAFSGIKFFYTRTGTHAGCSLPMDATISSRPTREPRRPSCQ